MGYLKDKYTEEYYTGRSKSGKKLNYGATCSLGDGGDYVLRDHDKMILQKVDFKDRAVLALGCGRGEELLYAINNASNVKDTIGVDFSNAAIKICEQLFSRQRYIKPKLYNEDALEFVSRYADLVKAKKARKFDIVIMFDFVEHVPRKELEQALIKLKDIISKKAIIILNTPAYRYDNDVIEDGYDERNNIGTFDTSDDNPNTKGMHCNKYSRVSLQSFMGKCGYINVTEGHYFIDSQIAPKDFGNLSYYDRWVDLRKRGVPITGEYSDDIIEYPYGDLTDLGLFKFKNGNLNGITIYTTDSYRNLAYPGGDTDYSMMESIKRINPSNKVIFDIGTFVGVCSMLFSKMVGKNGRVIGFEPNPTNRNRAFLNLSHNSSLSPNITIYKQALGSKNVKQSMLLSQHIDIGHSSTSRLSGSHSTIHDLDLPEGFEEFEVEVKTLDTFVSEENIQPDILKVDIEGAEYEFLLGAAKTIKRTHPIIYMELHSQYCAAKCTEFLVLEGYLIKVLHEEEDNRIMIMAEYTGKTGLGVDIERLETLNSAFSTLKNMAESLAIINRECQIKEQQLHDLAKEKNSLLAEKERANITESINKDLLDKIKKIESSRSWAITKPLRKVMGKARSIKE